MATNKNQHFVPRCHLKSFTLNSDGRSINLYNLDRRQLIKNAPVKNQCSRDYFYGKDPNLESAIQTLEGSYATVISLIGSNPNSLKKPEAIFLSSFWIFQHLRTEIVQQNMLKQSHDLEEAVGGNAPDIRIEKQHATLLALGTFAKNYEAVADLNAILIKNKSTTPFITSDNPAVQTNRWALSRTSSGVATFGMHSAGAVAFLPLSPHLLIMLYDKDIYSITHTNGILTIRNDRDIRALNEHQHLNCAVNVYLPPCFTTEHIADFPDLTAQRAASGQRIHIFQKRNKDEDRYYAVESFDRSSGTEAIFATPTYYSHPTVWPSFLHWRNKGFYFSNGSGIGQVRRAWIPRELAGQAFQKFYTGH